MFTPNETYELLKLHEKMDTLTKAYTSMYIIRSLYDSVYWILNLLVYYRIR